MARISELYRELESLGLLPQGSAPRVQESESEEPMGEDSDIYDALIGSAPTSKENQKAMAKALRRRRNFGELAAVSGDEVLAPMGGQMLRTAESQVDQLQKNRQMDIDNAQTRRYQEGQLDHMGGLLGENKRNNTMDFLVQALAAEAANTRAENPKGGKPPRLRVGDINNLRENANAQGTIKGTMDFMNSGGKLGAVEMAGVPIPMLRQTMNAASRMGIGSDDMKDTQLQWQNYQRFYELAERNNLFGATLTANEQRAWRSANPSVAQTDEQIMEGLKIMAKVYQNQGDAFASGLAEEGYDPEAIDSYRQQQNVTVGAEQSAAPVAGAEAAVEAQAPKRVKITKEQILEAMRGPAQ